MKIICNISVFYLDKTVPKGSLLIECGHLLEKKKYQIRFFNTINFKKSLHYNPFHYIHSEKDILKLANVLITNTDSGQKSGDPFWRNAEMLLYCALMGYIFYEAPPHEQNFNTLVAMINAMEVREDDDNFKNPVDLLFDALEEKDPDHFAVRQYHMVHIFHHSKFLSWYCDCIGIIKKADSAQVLPEAAGDRASRRF